MARDRSTVSSGCFNRDLLSPHRESQPAVAPRAPDEVAERIQRDQST